MTKGKGMGGTESGAGTREPARKAGAWTGVVCALGVYELGITLLNTSVFPLFNGVFLEARDVATLFSSLLALGLYALVSAKPGTCRPRTWTAASVALYVVGVPMMLWGALVASPGLLTAGVLLRAVGTTWLTTLLYLQVAALAREQGARRLLGALCAGWALSYALELALTALPLSAQLIAFFASALVAAALSYRPSLGLLGQMVANAPTAELRVTNPRSFLPAGSALFVTLVLLKASFGFAVTFASVEATPQATVLACVPALLVACGLLAAGRCSLDAVYKAAMLCVLAGFLLVNPLVASMTNLPAAANVVLRAGADLTRMLAFMLVAQLGTRNPMAATGVALFVCGATSLGSLAGAQLGMLANGALEHDPALFSLLLAAGVFAFVAYNVLSPDVFKLDETVRGIEEVKPVQTSAPVDVLAGAVQAAAQRYGLTPRETQALELLAHGRNTAAIEERMVVSRSTAKTHIRNVYAKLGVHSQQDLIDLVERTDAK